MTTTTRQPRPARGPGPDVFDVPTPEADALEQIITSATARPAPRRLPLTEVWQLGCRTFSATLREQRNLLGEQVTQFLTRLRAVGGQVTDHYVRQSSDDGWHCLSIILFYRLPEGARL